MKLTTSYNTVTIESSLTKKQLETAQAYAAGSDILVVEKVPVFKIGFGKSGDANKYGVTFDSKTAAGKMFFSKADDAMPDGETERRTYLQDTYGPILYNLAAIEQQINDNLTARATAIASVAEAITIG